MEDGKLIMVKEFVPGKYSYFGKLCLSFVKYFYYNQIRLQTPASQVFSISTFHTYAAPLLLQKLVWTGESITKLTT